MKLEKIKSPKKEKIEIVKPFMYLDRFRQFSIIFPIHFKSNSFNPVNWEDLRKQLLGLWGYLAVGSQKWTVTGKSFSEALILASTNPQYDKFCPCSALVFLMVQCVSEFYIPQ